MSFKSTQKMNGFQFLPVISAHKIHISEACKAILDEHDVHVIMERGEMEIKVGSRIQHYASHSCIPLRMLFISTNCLKKKASGMVPRITAKNLYGQKSLSLYLSCQGLFSCGEPHLSNNPAILSPNMFQSESHF